MVFGCRPANQLASSRVTRQLEELLALRRTWTSHVTSLLFSVFVHPVRRLNLCSGTIVHRTMNQYIINIYLRSPFSADRVVILQLTRNAEFPTRASGIKIDELPSMFHPSRPSPAPNKNIRNLRFCSCHLLTHWHALSSPLLSLQKSHHVRLGLNGTQRWSSCIWVF